MFLLFKLAFIIGAFLYRILNRPLGFFGDSKTIEGTDLKIVHSKYSSSVLIPFKSRFIFKLNPETQFDKFLKGLGLAKEFQTGNKEFDDRIYLASDSLTLNKHLAEDIDFINLVIELSKIGFDQIVVDGNNFRLKFSKDKLYENNYLHRAVKIFHILESIEKKWHGKFLDAFAWKYILTEGLLWSIAGYAVSILIEFSEGVAVYYDIFPLVKEGLIIGAITAITLIVFIFYQFRGSSRGHRIIIECAVIIIFAIPISTIDLICVLNEKLDHSKTVKIELLIEDKKITVTHSRRRTTRYYRLELAQKNHYRIYQIPPTLDVESDLYELASIGDYLIIEVSPGRLKHPWYKKMTVSPTSSLAKSKQ
jgi:hypothetical protein